MQVRGGTSASSASLSWIYCHPPVWTGTASQCPPGSPTSTAMGSQWLLLMLLFIGDGIFNLPGIITTWGCESGTTTSMSKETTVRSDVSSALSNIKRDNTPTVPLATSVTTRRAAMAESQKHTPPATISTSRPAYSSAGSAEQATPMHKPQEEIVHTTNITTSKGTTLSNSTMTSTLKDQGRTASSTMATADETSKQNQRTSNAAPLASSPTVNVLETSVSTDFQESSTVTAPTALNTPDNDVTSPVSMATTIFKKPSITTTLNISPITLNKITDMKGSLPMTTSAVIYTTSLTLTILGTTVPGTTMSGTREGETTAAPPTLTIAPTMSMLSETHDSTTAQTLSCAVESAPSAGTAMAQSPETTAVHSIALIPSSSGTTKSSALTGARQTSPKRTQTSSSRAGACASDGYPDSKGAVGAMTATTLTQTNSSHVLHSLEEQLLQDLPGFTTSNSTILSLSSVHPLVVNDSQTHPYPVISFSYSTIHVLGIGNTIVTLGIFMDPELSSPLENRPAPLGNPLYVVLRAPSSDPDRFALVANEVFASTSIFVTAVQSATGCSGAYGTTGPPPEVTLAFKLFRLNSDMLYLHGRVTLCDKQAGRPCQLGSEQLGWGSSWTSLQPQQTCSQKNPPGKDGAWARKHSESGVGCMVFRPIRISGNSIFWEPF